MLLINKLCVVCIGGWKSRTGNNRVTQFHRVNEQKQHLQNIIRRLIEIWIAKSVRIKTKEIVQRCTTQSITIN